MSGYVAGYQAYDATSEGGKLGKSLVIFSINPEIKE